MWPFGTKDVGMIDDAWLGRQGIPIENRDAFEWRSSKLRSEIKRNKKVLQDLELDMQEHLDERRSKRLELDQLENKRDEAMKKAGKKWKTDQDVSEVLASLNQAKGELDRLDETTKSKRARIQNLEATIKMLNSIKTKRYTTPKQLTQEPILPKGDMMANFHDKLPRVEVDNSSIMDDYFEEE